MQAQFMDQPVVDQTGLGTQRYNFVLKWTPDAAQRAAGTGPEANSPVAVPDADTPPGPVHRNPAAAWIAAAVNQSTGRYVCDR